MKKILDWVKKNKLAVFLLLVIFFLLLKNRPASFIQRNIGEYQMASKGLGIGGGGGSFEAPVPQEPAPVSPVNFKERLVIKDSYLSLVVNNVLETQKMIIKKTEELGGYMVSSNLDKPEETPSATVVIRVPSEKLEKALSYFRSLSVKIVSENLSGYDITDQYVDVEKRLETLYKTKAKFEEILEKASRVSDILEVQRELINLQSQIDSLKGQENYLKESAKLAKITVYLSTDELSLPYAPSDSWRPKVIFKQAVRSLVSSLRKIATLAIWLAVYSVILVPLCLIVYLIYKFSKRKK